MARPHLGAARRGARARISARGHLERPVEPVELPREARAAPRSPPRAHVARRSAATRALERADRAARRRSSSAATPPRRWRRRCESCPDPTLPSRSPVTHHSTILLSGYSTMPWRARGLEPRDQIADRALLDDRVDRDPLVVAQRRDRRPLQRRQQREHASQIVAPHVQHQADAALRFDRRLAAAARCSRAWSASTRRRAPSRWRSAACSTPAPCR